MLEIERASPNGGNLFGPLTKDCNNVDSNECATRNLSKEHAGNSPAILILRN